MSEPAHVADLRTAVIRGQRLDVLSYLRKFPDQVNAKDSEGVTLLMETAANNHIQVLTILLDQHADLTPLNWLGRDALMEAACRGHPAIILRLCQSRPNLQSRNARHPLQLTSLMEAASRGHSGATFWLCEARADINATTLHRDTSLMLAAQNNRYEAVQVLVAQGANLDITDDSHRTALDIAAARGHTRIVDFLNSPQIRQPTWLKSFCTQIKNYQRVLLQSEVNYDASVLSRQFSPLHRYTELPAFRQNLAQVQIEGAQFPFATLAPKTYHTQPFQYDPTLHVARRTPFTALPKFGSCSWLAIQPQRLRRQNDKSNLIREESFHEEVGLQQCPYLTLYDNGQWTYQNDMQSGPMNGTYQIHTVITHGIAQANAEPGDSIFSISLGLESSTGATTGGSAATASATGAMADSAPVYPFLTDDVPDWEYFVTLTTSAETAEVQTVRTYLGKHIVLGELVMEMAPRSTPWWRFQDIAQSPATAAVANTEQGQSSMVDDPTQPSQSKLD